MNTNFLLNKAVKAAKFKTFREEYWLGISITAFVRFLAAAISIYAGYYYFENLLAPINIENKIVPTLLAVLLLAVIEFFSAWILGKMTKSIIERQYQRAAILGVFSLFTFGASFWSSTNGLAMRQSQKVDNTDQIVTMAETEKQAVAAKYDAIIGELKSRIADEKANPQGWRGNRRVYLTDEQLQRIKKTNDEISLQREAMKAEISEIKDSQSDKLTVNRSDMTETASKYWNFIAIVMIISMISNIAVQSFYMKMFAEEKAEMKAEADTRIGMRTHQEYLTGILAQNTAEGIQRHQTALILSGAEKDAAYEYAKLAAEKKNYFEDDFSAPKITGFRREITSPKIDIRKDDENDGRNDARDTRKSFDLKAFNESYKIIGDDARNAYRNDTHESSLKLGTLVCPVCAKKFTPKNERHTYCCTECRQKAFRVRENKRLDFKQ